MENKPCAKCGKPSLEEFNGCLIAPVNRPYNICEKCWNLLTKEQQQYERDIRGIRIDVYGTVWLGRYNLQHVIEKCDKVMELENYVKKLESDLLRITNILCDDVIEIKEKLSWHKLL